MVQSLFMLIILNFGPRQKTQTEPTKKKITQSKPRIVKSTQTEPATSGKPMQNEWRLKICAQSGSGGRRLTQTNPIKTKIIQTKPAISENPYKMNGGLKFVHNQGQVKEN